MKISALPIRFGIAISSSLIAFFLILSLFNVNTNPFYSFFNAVIIGFGIYDALKLYKLREGSGFNYSKGFSIGITTGFVATFLFAIFFVFYVSQIDSEFIPKLLEHFKWSGIMDIPSSSKLTIKNNSAMVPSNFIAMEIIVYILAALSVIILGFLTSIIVTLAFMQLFKRKSHL